MNARDKRGRTAVHAAAELNTAFFLTEIMDITKFDVNLNARDKYGRTPLNVAAACGKPLIVRELLDLGVNLNTPDKYGRTPLISAIAMGNSAGIANLLITANADLYKKDRYGRTALHYAAQRFFRFLFRKLVNLGLSVNEPDNRGVTPADIALSHRKIDADPEFLAFVESLIVRPVHIDRSTVLDPVAPTETIPEI